RDDSDSLRREQWTTSQALHHEKGPAQDGRIDAGQEHARRRIAEPSDSVLDGAFGEDTSRRMLGAEDSENQRDPKGVRGVAQTEREDPSVIAAHNRRGLFGVTHSRRVELRAEMLEQESSRRLGSIPAHDAASYLILSV